MTFSNHPEHRVLHRVYILSTMFFFYSIPWNSIRLGTELKRKYVIKNSSLSRTWYRGLQGCAIASVTCIYFK